MAFLRCTGVRTVSLVIHLRSLLRGILLGLVLQWASAGEPLSRGRSHMSQCSASCGIASDKLCKGSSLTQRGTCRNPARVTPH